MISNTQITAQPEYDIQFWNAMRNKEAREDILAKGRDISIGTYSMPTVAAGKVMNGEDFLAYYGERKLILRVAFERYLRNHPELRRRG